MNRRLLIIARALLAGVLALTCVAAHADPTTLPSAVHAELVPPTDDELFKQFADSLDAGDSNAKLIADARERGIGFAIRCAALLDQHKPRAAEVIYEIIGQAGRSRGSNQELLRLYDPQAHRLFWGDRIGDQTLLAVALTWEQWPGALPDAAVRAAPLPTLQWLKQQAGSSQPRLADLRSIFRAWGWFVRAGYEQQHLPAVQAVIVALGHNQVLLADVPTHAALLRFAGESKAVSAVDAVLQGLNNDAAPVRSAAGLAAARIASADTAVAGRGRDALVDRAGKEQDVEVASIIAEAAESFGGDSAMGEAMLALFQRSRVNQVSRGILYSSAKATWPQRDAIVVAGLGSPDGGVVGAALQAVTIRPTPALADATLKLLEHFQPAPKQQTELLKDADADSAQPQLVDALGAIGDRKAVPRLAEWLKAEVNPAIRLKICLALEKIGGEESAAVLQHQMDQETNEMLMAQLIAIAGRMQLPGADAMIVSLVTDKTAPAPLRRAAIATIGYFHTPAVDKALAEMSSHPETTLPPDDSALSVGKSDRLEQAKLLIALARLRQGHSDEKGTSLNLFEKAAPEAQVRVLSTLAEMKHDDPAIARGLASNDYAVLWMAVRAAQAADPVKYHSTLQTIQKAPFIAALSTSQLDTLGLSAALNAAITAGESR